MKEVLKAAALKKGDRTKVNQQYIDGVDDDTFVSATHGWLC